MARFIPEKRRSFYTKSAENRSRFGRFWQWEPSAANCSFLLECGGLEILTAFHASDSFGFSELFPPTLGAFFVTLWFEMC